MSSKTEKAAPVVPAGIRLHELAKEIGIPSKELLEKAIALGIPKIKSHSSILTHGQADRLRAKFGGVKKLKAELDENKAAKAAASKKKGKTTKAAEDDGAEEAP